MHSIQSQEATPKMAVNQSQVEKERRQLEQQLDIERRRQEKLVQLAKQERRIERDRVEAQEEAKRKFQLVQQYNDNTAASNSSIGTKVRPVVQYRGITIPKHVIFHTEKTAYATRKTTSCPLLGR